MKNVLLFCLLLMGILSSKIMAQPSEAVAKEKMKVFESWPGHWKGEGSMQMGPGPAKKSTVDEYLEFKLDGTILLVEGIGKAVDGQSSTPQIVHHAMGILSFDQITNEYKFNTYLKDGKSTLPWFKIVEESKYQWGFDIPNGKIRYSITIDPTRKTWNEIGEFSNDNGTSWMKFFEMNLKKA